MDSETFNRLWALFMPYAAAAQSRLKAAGTRFVHYTSADSGLKILRSGRMLLRNSTLMNDFSEVQHGMNCLQAAYAGAVGERLKTVMRQIQADLPEIVEATFNGQFLDVRSETYLLSISEHGDPEDGDQLEDRFGRLSMWRAYAARNGVAFVFKNTPFLNESDAINAYSSPVLYATPEDFSLHFANVVSGFEANVVELSQLGGQFFHDSLIGALRFAIQSTKHPSFREEREWRVIYSPTLLSQQGKMTAEQLEKIPTEVIALGGVPQRVYAIPFRDHPNEGMVGATIPSLVDRVLIGPSMDAYPIAQAFAHELAACGVVEPESKIVITGVPLRT